MLAAMPQPVLYPVDPLNPRRVDSHFSGEAEAARALGAATPLLDHDALLLGDTAEAVRRVPRDLGPVWYRGWMIPADRYAELDAALRGRGGALAVSPDAYRSAHELPGWYPVFRDATPASVWCALEPGTAPSAEALADLVRPLGPGPGIVKDFVKSRKSEWDTACFVPELADTAALHRIATAFVELQEEFLAGGVVVRAFEDFGGEGRSAEARVWWVDAEPAVVGPHPDTPEQSPEPELDHVAGLVAELGCPFVTTDLALRSDGVWRVVEVGDGQVSDRPASVAPEKLLGALLAS